MKKASLLRNLVVALFCIATTSALAMENYTETFDTDDANWRYPNGQTNLDWHASGGPAGDGDGYVSATGISFSGKSPNSFYVVARGNESYGSSGGAFAGNWITSGVYQISMDVRHDVPQPIRIGIRIAKGNHPAVAIVPSELIPPGEWKTIRVPVTSNATGYLDYNFEGQNFAAVFKEINSIQPMLYVPEEYTSPADTNLFTIDMDNASISIAGSSEPVSANEPTYDRWLYTFGATDGTRPEASTYRTVDPRFDERDAQAYFAFVLTNEIPAGLGANSYQILSCRFEATVNAGSPNAPIYDPTLDEWTSYLDSGHPLFTADEDAGRPMELYGAGWSYDGYTPWTFGEAGLLFTNGVNYGNPDTKGQRTVYPIMMQDGQAIDVSNNIDPDGTGTNGFTAIPFAIGTAELTPGDSLPANTTFTFDLNTEDAGVQSYLAQALNEGILPLIISTLHLTAQPGEDASGLILEDYPNWVQKENLADQYPATLEITYLVSPSLELGLEGGVRVARWAKTSAEQILEATDTLVSTNVNWLPIVTVGEPDEIQNTVTLPEGGDKWFFRLRQP
ncbi:MAG: hypothetical protein M5U15_07185 [Kiritimatiellae bacterium]|nr:hypothetical protein [Kiritimatiellia bacterium]